MCQVDEGRVSRHPHEPHLRPLSRLCRGLERLPLTLPSAEPSCSQPSWASSGQLTVMAQQKELVSKEQSRAPPWHPGTRLSPPRCGSASACGQLGGARGRRGWGAQRPPGLCFCFLKAHSDLLFRRASWGTRSPFSFQDPLSNHPRQPSARGGAPMPPGGVVLCFQPAGGGAPLSLCDSLGEGRLHPQAADACPVRPLLDRSPFWRMEPSFVLRRNGPGCSGYAPPRPHLEARHSAASH